MGFEKLPYEFGLTEKMYAGRKTKWCGRKHSSITCCYLPFPPPPKKKKSHIYFVVCKGFEFGPV